VGYGLFFGWAMLGSAFQAIKMLPLYKRRKSNKKKTETRKQSKEILIEKGHCCVTDDIATS
jgi:hypothetical protein